MAQEFIVWEVKCINKDGTVATTFIVVDDGDDPSVQCPHCHIEQDSHNIAETDAIKAKCWRCSGTGEIPHKRYGDTEVRDITCPSCDGTGEIQHGHTRIRLGTLTGDQIKRFALKEGNQ